MSDLFDAVSRFCDQLRAGHQPLPIVATIPSEHCRPANNAGYPIIRDRMYFTVRVNEMHLAENRKWWTLYDPLVLVVVEFNHAQNRIAIPTVIGPELVRKCAPADQPRHGAIVLDARVTGPHPYRGGDVDISLSFYQVQRANHARLLLKVVESLSASLGGAGDLPLIAKTGAALLGGIEGLLGLDETTYLAGHRISLAISPLDPFAAGFSALIAPPAPVDNAMLRVAERRLFVEADGGVRPYRESDFVLLSVTGAEDRGDENLLPFYPLKTDALAALWDGDNGVKRGKANLITAYQQMRRSPDVTAAEAVRLFDGWLAEFEAEKNRAERVKAMPAVPRKEEPDPLRESLNNAVTRLAL
jgi:hypothetical protein